MEILGQRCACLVFAGLNVCISAVIHLQHSVHPGWNSLTACTQALLKRKGALQELWSARKFSFQADRVDGQAPELPRSERFHVTGNFIRGRERSYNVSVVLVILPHDQCFQFLPEPLGVMVRRMPLPRRRTSGGTIVLSPPKSDTTFQSYMRLQGQTCAGAGCRSVG